LQGLLRYKRDWKEVENYVKTRSSTQCRSHAQKFFKKLQRRGVSLQEVIAFVPQEELSCEEAEKLQYEKIQEFISEAETIY
jgi:hypothetical protein